MTYYLTFASLLIVNVLASVRHDLRQISYWAVLLGLFVFVGFRGLVGCDWIGYMGHFLTVSQLAEADALLASFPTLEPAEVALLYLLQRLNMSLVALNVISASFFFAGLHVLARRQPNPLAFIVLAFPILIINMPMSAVRQAVAIGFLCFAYAAFLDRRIWRYCLFVLCGTLFHYSAAVFLVLAPFIRKEITKKSIMQSFLVALPVCCCLLFFASGDRESLSYVDGSRVAKGAVYRLGLLAMTGLVFFSFLKKRWKESFPNDVKLVTLNALAMILLFFVIPVSTIIGDRYGYYLIPAQLMILVRLPYLFQNHYRQVITAAPYIILTLTFIVWTIGSVHFHRCYLPYHMFF